MLVGSVYVVVWKLAARPLAVVLELPIDAQLPSRLPPMVSVNGSKGGGVTRPCSIAPESRMKMGVNINMYV